MAEATTAELANTANNLSLTVETIQQQLALLLQTPYNETAGRLKAADRAKFQVMLAYTLNSLFWVYLKMQGDAVEAHPVKKELDRIRVYINKIQEIENPPQPTMTIDKDAAARFIKHHLPKSDQPTEQDDDVNHSTQSDHSDTVADSRKKSKVAGQSSNNESSKSQRKRKSSRLIQ
ncbi:Sas10/Utp3/C1D family-domain-containing protein [Syncephalis fuscata]|nr:Sas10/Utp3/C1D family-domain-containing protein [Syncephalis fuscata]